MPFYQEVYSALMQGKVEGILETLQYQNPEITKEELLVGLSAVLKHLKMPEEDIVYWIKEYNLD